jgi:hypothetical protein
MFRAAVLCRISTMLVVATGVALAGDHPLTNELDDSFRSLEIKTIAALPLYSDISDSDDPEHVAPAMVESKFYSALNAGSGFNFFPASEVGRTIEAKKMTKQMQSFYRKFTSDQEDIDAKFIQAVATELHTDAVAATVLDLWQQQPVDVTETGSARTTVGLMVALFDGKTGKRVYLARDENYKEAVRHTGQNLNNEAENRAARGQMDRSNVRVATGVYAPPPFEEVVELVSKSIVEAFPKRVK